MKQILKRRGRCHVFGDDVPLDDGFIPFELAISRVDEPARLIPELFRQVDPSFAGRVQKGDIVIGGHRFAGGKPHFQGFVAMAALDLSIICTSMPYKSLRGAISKGVPVMTGFPDTADCFFTEDDVEVDFVEGVITNWSRDLQCRCPRLATDLVSIILGGGTRGSLKSWLAKHPAASAEKA
jgi:3-isopropylmalate/(R)-2-methylmalate dehydratase small subunit